MVRKFEVGKSYKFIGDKIHHTWSEPMKVVIDHKVRLCTAVGTEDTPFYSGDGDALFDGVEGNFTGVWGWGGNMREWVEVDADGNDVILELTPEEEESNALRILLDSVLQDSDDSTKDDGDTDGFRGFMDFLRMLSDDIAEDDDEYEDDDDADDDPDFLSFLASMIEGKLLGMGENEGDKPLAQFEVGKSYRFLGEKPCSNWSEAMAFVADGKPHKVTSIGCKMFKVSNSYNNQFAHFEGMPYNSMNGEYEEGGLNTWAWGTSLDAGLWEEVV